MFRDTLMLHPVWQNVTNHHYWSAVSPKEQEDQAADSTMFPAHHKVLFCDNSNSLGEPEVSVAVEGKKFNRAFGNFVQLRK